MDESWLVARIGTSGVSALGSDGRSEVTKDHSTGRSKCMV